MNDMEERMACGTPFETMQICAIAEDMGLHWRKGDAAVRQWSRRGWITFSREGRDTVWRLTKEGHEAVRRMTEEPK